MRRLSRWFVRASLVYLVAGFTLGAVMLTCKAVTWPHMSRWLMAPHIEFLLIGWTVQLTMGVAFWILPRFEGGRSRGMVGAAWLAFALLNLGVLLTASEPFFHGAGFTRLSGRAVEAGAVVAFCLHAWPRVRAASTHKGER